MWQAVAWASEVCYCLFSHRKVIDRRFLFSRFYLLRVIAQEFYWAELAMVVWLCQPWNCSWKHLFILVKIFISCMLHWLTFFIEKDGIIFLTPCYLLNSKTLPVLTPSQSKSPDFHNFITECALNCTLRIGGILSESWSEEFCQLSQRGIDSQIQHGITGSTDNLQDTCILISYIMLLSATFLHPCEQHVPDRCAHEPRAPHHGRDAAPPLGRGGDGLPQDIGLHRSPVHKRTWVPPASAAAWNGNELVCRAASPRWLSCCAAWRRAEWQWNARCGARDRPLPTSKFWTSRDNLLPGFWFRSWFVPRPGRKISWWVFIDLFGNLVQTVLKLMKYY